MCSLVLNNWEQKYCQTLGNKPNLYTMCCEDNYFTKGKFKLFNNLFHSVYLVSKSLFPTENLFALHCLATNNCLPCLATKINAVLWHRTRQTFAPLGLFRFARIACLLQLWIKTSKLDYSIWASHASLYLTNIIGTWHHVHFGPVNNVNNTCNNFKFCPIIRINLPCTLFQNGGQ